MRISFLFAYNKGQENIQFDFKEKTKQFKKKLIIRGKFINYSCKDTVILHYYFFIYHLFCIFAARRKLWEDKSRV